MQDEQNDRDRDDMAGVWRNAQHRRNEDLGLWLRHLFMKPKQSASIDPESRRGCAVAVVLVATRQWLDGSRLEAIMAAHINRRDASSPFYHRGTVVVASAWLAFYIVAAIHQSMTAGNAPGVRADNSGAAMNRRVDAIASGALRGGSSKRAGL